jgi:hypothetical protein
MITETITFTQRKNLGNYEHMELTVSARLGEKDNALEAIAHLKNMVLLGFDIEANASVFSEPKVVVPETPVEEVVAEVTPEEPKKPKATKKVKEKVVEEKVVPYDRNIDAHRQFLSSYLTQAHPEWKTTEGVKEFSLSLIGKPFLDDSGHIVESFKKVLSDFFS